MNVDAAVRGDGRVPTLFLSHGAPSMVLEPGATGEFLRELGKRLPRPRAIVSVSAHWDTARPTVTGCGQPATIHDFYGFLDALYRVRYPAPGDPELAADVVELLGRADFDAGLDPRRGLDHGCWAPLALMYPEADIPVIQLSVQSALGAGHHLAVGRALSALRSRGVLIVGSGGATHNLRAFRGQPADSPVADFAAEFDAWLHGVVTSGDIDALACWRERAPQAVVNHPTSEHFVPLLVASGAADDAPEGRAVHTGFTYGILSMAAFAWGGFDDAGPEGGGLLGHGGAR